MSFNQYNKHDQTHGTALYINQMASVKTHSEGFFQLSQESTSLAGAGVDAKGQCQQDHGFGVCWAQLG